MAPTTRRQKKQHDATIQKAGLQSSTKSSESTILTYPSSRKRKASTQEHEELPAFKRVRHVCTCYPTQTGTEAELRTAELSDTSNEPSPTESSNTTPSHEPSAFLCLPRELRDEIYKHILNSGQRRVVILRHGSLLSKTGLLATNTQLRTEFLEAILLIGPVIHTTVLNHNFAPLVTFLNKLSDAQIRRLGAAARRNADPEATTRSRKIIVTLTYTPTKTSTRPSLNRWLDRFDDPGRRGAEVRIEYRLDRLSWGSGGHKQRVIERRSSGPRSREEARKMIRATGERGTGRGW